MLKLLGITRSRVSALPQAATSAPGVRKAGEYQGKPLRCGINPTWSRFFWLEMVSLDKEIYTQEVVSRKI
jgi:hypothetical protein